MLLCVYVSLCVSVRLCLCPFMSEDLRTAFRSHFFPFTMCIPMVEFRYLYLMSHLTGQSQLLVHLDILNLKMSQAQVTTLSQICDEF